MSDNPENFDAIKERLDQIVDEVAAEGISLDDALALYEEAISLGLAACNVSEEDILGIVEEESDDAQALEAGAQADAMEAMDAAEEAVQAQSM